MLENKYEYAFWDLSYIIQRNLYGVSRNKSAGEYSSGDLIKSCLQTFNKVPRDFGITADKHILLLDRWDGDKGYITTQILGGAYKDSRGDIDEAKGKASPADTFMTREKYEKLKRTFGVTKEDLAIAYEKLYKNEVRAEAKQRMIENLCNFGLPSIGVVGWEFDNLAYLASMMLYRKDAKPSVIITQDSDLTYMLSPKMDFFKIPRSGQEPKVITYNEMYLEIPDSLKNKISLYEYKSYLDSLGVGHNSMRKTKKALVDPVHVIEEILDGNYSDVTDVDLFKLQLSTFKIENYPRFDEARRSIIKDLPVCGKLGTVEEWRDFTTKCEVGLGDGFYSSFIQRFNPDKYKKE